MYCIAECPIHTYYQEVSSSGFRVVSTPTTPTQTVHACPFSECPSSPVAYFGDDSTGLCVESSVALILECSVNVSTV